MEVDVHGLKVEEGQSADRKYANVQEELKWAEQKSEKQGKL